MLSGCELYPRWVPLTFTGCEFKPNVSSAVASEDNFGLYSDVNVKFRCTAGDYSTTQWWFGGYLTK